MTISTCSVVVVECPSRKAPELEPKVEEQLRLLAGFLHFAYFVQSRCRAAGKKNMSVKAPQVIITSRLRFFFFFFLFSN